MRTFQNVEDAIREIRRDLSKAPQFISSRVQASLEVLPVREATNYAFTILQGGIPPIWTDYLKVLKEHLPFYRDLSINDEILLNEWVMAELEQRTMHGIGQTMDFALTETIHPFLATVSLEGSHPSYTYRERTIGMVPSLCRTLDRAHDSRRAFWPIFQPTDAFRAADLTRVPCTIGYNLMIREVVGQDGEPQELLNMTNLMRSCDFGIYWATDLWFAAEIQRYIADRLGVETGTTSQIILSFHTFDRGEEIF